MYTWGMSNLAEALDTITRIDAAGDKIRLGYTATVMGRSVAHKDAKPTSADEARAALNTLANLGAEFQSITVYRHESEMI